MNDWSPVFSQKVYNCEMIENNYVGVTVIQVNATDRDKGDNAKIVYEMTGEYAGSFYMDATTGAIKALVSFDREVRSEVTLNVTATDRGAHPRFDSLSSTSRSWT